MKTTVRLTPSPKQWQFMTAPQRFVAYGGARGGGKSWVVRLNAIRYALDNPGSRQLIVRKTYAEVIANHVEPMMQLLGKQARYNKTDKIIRFPNGSIIKFGYFSKDSDQDQYQGQEYDVIYVDEATQLQEEWLKRLIACNRGVNSFPKHIYLTCNPGGPAHGYIRRLYVDRKFNAAENPDDYTFIQAKVDDNAALMAAMPEYAKMLETLPPKLRKAWRDGSWDIFEGAFFDSFVDNEEGYDTRTWTHVIPDFNPPKYWTYYRSFDWGSRRPFSVGWYAIDTEGRMYRIAELYGCQHDTNGEAIPNEGVKWTPGEVFKAIRDREHEHPYLKGKRIFGIADPAIWDAQTGISIAEVADEYCVFFEPGDHARVAGWQQCQYRLRFD